MCWSFIFKDFAGTIGGVIGGTIEGILPGTFGVNFIFDVMSHSDYGAGREVLGNFLVGYYFYPNVKF
jgi:hypothetical protein